ncbi:MAG: hypothetical protein LC104_13565 [Bacteroidales bacterium]|nr:hypothetical protein [Bacteroidales bacterium]
MSRLDTINLIRLFDFYLAVAFLFSFRRRYRIYWDALRLGCALPLRWPKLVDRLRFHGGILLTRDIVWPALIVLAFMAIQFVLSRVLFPQAQLTGNDLIVHPVVFVILFLTALPMLAVDGYFLWRVGRFDRLEAEGYLDQAEQWLSTWRVSLVRTVTLGYVNPRQMVDDELRKALLRMGEMARWSMWWVTAQIACRMVFGLVLWLCWLLL